MKYNYCQLKALQKELAIRSMQLEDALYEDPYNEELRADLEDANEEYEYVSALVERYRPDIKIVAAKA